MKRTKPPALLVLNVASIALAVACSGSLTTPLGPTGSDTTAPSNSNKSTIRGRTSTTSSPSSTRSTAAASSSSARQVCVTGTTNCTNLDSNGKFELGGNFSGDVPLTFTTPQGVASVTVPGVVAGETIVIVVKLAGASGSVSVESRGNGDNNGNVADDDSEDDDADDDTSDDPSEDDDSEDADDDSDDDSDDDDSEDDDSDDDDSEDDDSEDDDHDSGHRSGPNEGKRG